MNKSRFKMNATAFKMAAFFVLMLTIPASAQISTNIPALEQMSSRLKFELDNKRPQLYYDLLASDEKAQKQLNENHDIKLIFIDSKGQPFYYQTQNLNAAQTVSTDEVWPGGSGGFNLTGSSTVIGELAVWDGGGVLTTHQELTGRVNQIDSPGGTHYHSTHVAGTMIASGVVGSAKGMSYQGRLAAYDWDYDESEMASAAASGLNVSNHSYGLIAGWYYNYDWYWFGDTDISETEDYGFGFYGDGAQIYDSIAYNAPYYTIVKSAGNDRNDYGPGAGGGHYVWSDGAGDWVWSYTTRDQDGGTDGYDCIGWYGNAKNIITVGAVADIPGGYSVPGDVIMSAFSGWGPTDDGRIKPDLVANGVDLYSCIDGSNTDYYSLSGTSMSTPNLSGSLNLLVRYYESSHSGITPRSATMKALLIHTADEAGSFDGPDYRFGWGLLNTLKAAEMIQTDSTNGGYMLEDSLANGQTHNYYITNNSGEPIRITIAWTDKPGTPPTPSLNPSNLMLVHDLNLLVERVATSTDYYPYVLNPSSPSSAASTGINYRDNVEQVYIDLPPAGSYRVEISHAGTLTSTQRYSIISSHQLNAFTPNQPPVALCTNITVEADQNCQGNGSVDNGSYDPDGDPITVIQQPSGPYPIGLTPVRLIVTDSTGLADTCSANITVEDNIPPTAICPGNINVDNTPGQCGATVSFAIDADDNCPGVSVQAMPPSGSFFAIGTTQVMVTATDNSDNTDTCYFNVTVNDTEPPVLSCPSDIVRGNDEGECGAAVTYTVDISDNCSEPSLILEPPSGSYFDLGTTTVRAIGVDSFDNRDTCYFSVTVNDTEPPNISSPNYIFKNNDPGQCGAVATYNVEAEDNCSDALLSIVPPSGTFFPIGLTLVEIIAADSSGNADTAYINVTVDDVELPQIDCPEDMVLSNDSGMCGAIVDYDFIVWDNCENYSTTSNPPSGSFFDLGTTEVYLTAEDSSGNADSCSFTITVNDDESPMAICPEPLVLEYDTELGGAIGEFESEATDNCPTVSIICDPPSGTLFPAGNTTVICVATDSVGNVDSCSFTVQVYMDGFEYVPGDANMAAGLWPPLVVGGDVTYLVNYFRGMVPACVIGGFYCSGDVNGDCSVVGSDVTFMVGFFRGFNSLSHCPDYPPLWENSGEAPSSAPLDWPPCEGIISGNSSGESDDRKK